MLTAAILMGTMMPSPASALDLDFNLNYEYSNSSSTEFGKPTSVEPVEVIDVVETKNINRSKDSAFIPPAFGSYSADTKGTGELLTPNLSGVVPMRIGSASDAASAIYHAAAAQTADGHSQSGTIPPVGSGNISVSDAENKFTLPDDLYDTDGSIGRLKIDEIGLSVKVYETESLESLAKGAGHFKSTSCWDGNIGICGHNRGVTNHFGKIHTLEKGDEIKYTTKLGTRTYAVISVTKIDETDFSDLQRTSDNRITLITCVENQPEKRWCVQAVEV